MDFVGCTATPEWVTFVTWPADVDIVLARYVRPVGGGPRHERVRSDSTGTD